MWVEEMGWSGGCTEFLRLDKTKIRRRAAVWRQRPGEWRLAHSGSLLPSVDGCFRLVVRGRGFWGARISLKWQQLCPPLGVVDTVLSAERQMQFCHESGGLVGAGGGGQRRR